MVPCHIEKNPEKKVENKNRYFLDYCNHDAEMFEIFEIYSPQNFSRDEVFEKIQMAFKYANSFPSEFENSPEEYDEYLPKMIDFIKQPRYLPLSTGSHEIAFHYLTFFDIDIAPIESDFRMWYS